MGVLIRSNPLPVLQVPWFSYPGSVAVKIALLSEIASRGNRDCACRRAEAGYFFLEEILQPSGLRLLLEGEAHCSSTHWLEGGGLNERQDKP